MRIDSRKPPRRTKLQRGRMAGANHGNPARGETPPAANEDAVPDAASLAGKRENVLLAREEAVRLREDDVHRRETQALRREDKDAANKEASADAQLPDAAQDDLYVKLRLANEKLVIASVQLQITGDESEKTSAAMTHIALHDFLTGLPNRNLFIDHLSREIRRAQREHKPVALMFLDLDGFKEVNDTLGHEMGDIVLKETAERLKNCVREVDTVARLGGDEFTIILADLHDATSVERVALDILHKLSEPFQLGAETAQVGISIGITLYPEDATDTEELIKNADQAMYAAKLAGRNRFHYFTPAMQEAAQARLRLIDDLRGALEGNQFEVAYQPIVELATGAIRKAEALIRWRHPTRGLISPADFIPTAEEIGMIASFGNWIFHEAAMQAAQWRNEYDPSFQISVNISQVQFKNEGIDLSCWLERLRIIGLPAQGIVVEITEGLLLDASDKVTDQLLAFRDAGVDVVLDDFGTGCSSLAYLKKFDIDYLKIDQSFVHNLTKESGELALCEAIIAMAHKLGIRVIAEGIETDEQRKLLAAAGCDYGQGYLFSRPATAESFEKMLRSGRRPV
jgi:diguanylate cyclase (GGDEF)-like protein